MTMSERGQIRGARRPLEEIDPEYRKRTIVIRKLWDDPVRRKQMLSSMLEKQKGIKRSEETRDKIRKAKLGTKMPEKSKDELSRVKGGRKLRGAGFVRRLAKIATNDELARMSGLEVSQIIQLKQDMRSRTYIPAGKGNAAQVRSRALKGKPRNVHGREYSQSELCEFAFMQKVVAQGWLTEDLSRWERLNQLYLVNGVRNNLKFPDKPAMQVHLEVFLMARERASIGDRSLLEEYFRLGDEIDSAWFDSDTLNDHRRFITDIVSGGGERRKQASKANSGVLFNRVGNFYRDAGILPNN